MELALAHLHSILVHFALALFTAGFVIEIIGWSTGRQKVIYAGALLIILGGLFGWATMYSGEPAEETMEELLSPAAEAALEVPEEWGEWTGWLILIAAAARFGLFWLEEHAVAVGTYLVYTGLVFLALLVTGYYGGKVTHAGHPHLKSWVAQLGPRVSAKRETSSLSKEESKRESDANRRDEDDV